MAWVSAAEFPEPFPGLPAWGSKEQLQCYRTHNATSEGSKFERDFPDFFFFFFW